MTAYLVWRLVVLLYQIFLQPHYKITEASVTLYQRVYLSWTTYWDVGHYIGIALKGYQYPQQAFFPLWYFLGSLVGGLTSMTRLAGVGIGVAYLTIKQLCQSSTGLVSS